MVERPSFHVGTQSVSENSFPPSVRPTLRYIWLSFRQRSPLRLRHSSQIFHKLWRASDGKQFSDTLWAAFVLCSLSTATWKMERERVFHHSSSLLCGLIPITPIAPQSPPVYPIIHKMETIKYKKP